MKRQTKLNSEEQQQQLQAAEFQQSEQSSVLEFATAEEMLRHDALHTPVPPGIESRLQESIDRTPRNKSWWRRWFGS